MKFEVKQTFKSVVFGIDNLEDLGKTINSIAKDDRSGREPEFSVSYSDG